MGTPDTWAFDLAATDLRMVFDYDGNGNQIYIGWAQPGAATSDTAWRIMQQTFNASNQVTDIKWPSASTGFSFVWTNRASYVYS